MNLLSELLHGPAASRLGETLLHFLWQGAAVAALLAAALGLLRRASANCRYTVGCAALALLAALPAATWTTLQSTAAPVVERSAVIRAGAAAFPAGLIPISQSPDPNWLSWLAVAWLAGVAVCMLRLAGGGWQVHRLRTRGVAPLAASWTERLLEVQRRLAVTRPVRLLESTRVSTPLVMGWLRPVILLPVGFVTGLPPAQVDAILAHELAHLRRHDFLVNLAQRLVETLLFYHPAVWWVSAQIRREREHACDDLAAEVLGSRRTLAEALVSLAERESSAPALAFAADGSPLGGRVRRLLGVAEPANGLSGPALLLVLLLAVGLGAGGLWSWLRFAGEKAETANAASRDPRRVLVILTQQLAELDRKIRERQREADDLVLALKIPNVVAEGGQLPGSDEVRRLLDARLDLHNRLAMNETLLNHLNTIATDSELRLALNQLRPNPLLQTLLADLQVIERKEAELHSEFGADHPERRRVNNLLAKINGQIDSVISGMVGGLRTQVDTDRTVMEQIGRRLEDAKAEEANGYLQLRPYLQTKRDLESLYRMRGAVELQMTQETINAELAHHGHEAIHP